MLTLLKHEPLKFNKVVLSGASVLGGLNSYEQTYKLFYLPSEGGLSSKIELAIILQKDGSQREYSSLRFESEAQLKGLINNFIRAYVFFGRSKGSINHFNFAFKMREVKGFVDDCFRCDTNKLKNYKGER